MLFTQLGHNAIQSLPEIEAVSVHKFEVTDDCIDACVE